MGVDAEMLVRVRAPLTAKQVKRVAWEMAGAFGPSKFFIMSGSYTRRALEIVKKWEQDGPTLRPKDGEQFLKVGLYGRFYGEGYERGDLPLYISIAEWLEQRIPKSTIWYGGDSSGCVAGPFGAVARAKLFAHFVRHGHRPYAAGWDLGSPGFARRCTFCDEPLRRFMWGGHDLCAGYVCHGCGFEEETRDAGKTWVTKKDIGGGRAVPDRATPSESPAGGDAP